MTVVDITINSREAEQMLQRLGARAVSRELSFAVGRAADQGARMISGVASDTGTLAGSVRAYGWNIVATARNPAGVPYGRFVFGGTQHMGARPPNVPAGAIGQILADEIRRTLFG